jgi:hypothetical protein
MAYEGRSVASPTAAGSTSKRTSQIPVRGVARHAGRIAGRCRAIRQLGRQDGARRLDVHAARLYGMHFE